MNENYRNYKLLLNTIKNSDYEEDKRNRYGVIVMYDTKNKELPVGVWKNASSLAAFLGTSRNCIQSTISKQKKVRNRFLLKRVYIEESESNE